MKFLFIKKIFINCINQTLNCVLISRSSGRSDLGSNLGSDIFNMGAFEEHINVFQQFGML